MDNKQKQSPQSEIHPELQPDFKPEIPPRLNLPFRISILIMAIISIIIVGAVGYVAYLYLF